MWFIPAKTVVISSGFLLALGLGFPLSLSRGLWRIGAERSYSSSRSGGWRTFSGNVASHADMICSILASSFAGAIMCSENGRPLKCANPSGRLATGKPEVAGTKDNVHVVLFEQTTDISRRFITERFEVAVKLVLCDICVPSSFQRHLVVVA